jgi:hypothetical protein
LPKCAEHEQGNAVLGLCVARFSDVARSRNRLFGCSTITRLVDRLELSRQPPRRDCLIQTVNLFRSTSHRRRSTERPCDVNNPRRPLNAIHAMHPIKGQVSSGGSTKSPSPADRIERNVRIWLLNLAATLPTGRAQSLVQFIPGSNCRATLAELRANHRVLRRIRHN